MLRMLMLTSMLLHFNKTEHIIEGDKKSVDKIQVEQRKMERVRYPLNKLIRHNISLLRHKKSEWAMAPNMQKIKSTIKQKQKMN